MTPTGSLPDPGIQVFYQDEDTVLLAWRNLYLSIWNGPITVDRLLPSFEVHRVMRRRYPEGFAALAVLRAGVPLRASRDTRLVIDALAVEARRSRMLCEATVIERGGFMAAAARAILSGMHAIIGHSHPRRTFDQIDMAMEWTLPFIVSTDGRATHPAELAELVTRFSPSGP